MYEQVIQNIIETGIRDNWANHASPVSSLREIREKLANRYFSGVKKLTVFGSFASGKHHEESDVDLLIECEPNLDIYLFTLNLEKILGRLCDVIELDSCRPWIKNRIISSPREVVYVR